MVIRLKDLLTEAYGTYTANAQNKALKRVGNKYGSTGKVTSPKIEIPKFKMPKITIPKIDISKLQKASKEKSKRLNKLYGSSERKQNIVDGMDVFKVISAAQEAGDYVRSRKGPYILEVQTYRYRGHSMSDAQHYRTKDEVEEYKKIDPITQIKDIILEKNYATQEELSAIDKEVKAMVNECEKFAEDSPYPETQQMYDMVYEQKDYPFIS